MTNSNFTLAPTQYPIQDDEQFIKTLKNQKKIFMFLSVYLIVLIPIILIASQLIPSLVDNDPYLTHISNVFCCIALCVDILVFILIAWRLKQVWYSDYFLTSKRLYLKTKKDLPHVAYGPENIKAIYTTPNRSLVILELINNETVKITLPISEHKKILDMFYKPQSDKKE